MEGCRVGVKMTFEGALLVAGGVERRVSGSRACVEISAWLLSEKPFGIGKKKQIEWLREDRAIG